MCADAPLQHDDREEGNSAPQSMTGLDANGQSYADVGLAPRVPGEAPVTYPLHLGETVTADGVKVTLVSFDCNGAQSVTFLVGG